MLDKITPKLEMCEKLSGELANALEGQRFTLPEFMIIISGLVAPFFENAIESKDASHARGLLALLETLVMDFLIYEHGFTEGGNGKPN